MSCSIKSKTITYLQDKGAINRTREVIDLSQFEYYNDYLTKMYYQKYDVGNGQEKLFKTENKHVSLADGRKRFLVRAIPNEYLFEQAELFNNQDNEFSKTQEEVNYNLKSIEILSSDKAKQIFTKGEKNNWDLNKILTELQIPKDQKQIILDKSINDREEIITSLLADNSFVVEINTSQKTNTPYIRGARIEMNNVDDLFSDSTTVLEESKQMPSEVVNTDYYSNLTVPGGTNYTENEIAIPAITPSIKGHAEFSTDNGIGWFRSDDRNAKQAIDDFIESGEADQETLESMQQNVDTSKTRRILEVQSDLFQKGRNKKDLVKQGNLTSISDASFNLEGVLYDKFPRGDYKKYINKEWVIISEKEYLEAKSKKDNPSQGNTFLQILNKKGNWVNFFIQSIVQDSAKKGYEKVLFPKGDTASKIEGHTTLEEFKKQKEDRIKYLEEELKNNFAVVETENDLLSFDRTLKMFNTEKEAQEYADNLPYTEYEGELDIVTVQHGPQKQNEINQLKKELERIETEGFGALKPIYSFYENRVTNILKKLYDVKEITDEYGNTWNEITIDPSMINDPIYLKKQDIDENAESKLEVSPNTDFTSFLEKDEMINFVLFNNQQEYKNEFSAVEVLDNIINNFNGLSKYSDEFIQKAKILSHTTKAKVKILDNPDYFNRKGAIMTYFNKQNQINLDLSILEEASLDYVIESFLHEVVHSVTVHSLKNPVTFEQKMFKDFITDAFNYYKEQMPGSTEYGFTNEVEFVAEIFTNPIFADKIKDIPSSVSSSKTFLQSFIDFIRSIFGLPKISKDKEISYNAVIDAIVAISPKNIPDGLLYKVQDKVFNKEQQGKKSVKNIDEKLVNTIENITVNIKEALEKSEFFLQRTKDENIKKRLNNYIDKTKTVLNEIENYAYVNQVKSITTFLNFMNSNIASIEYRINNMPENPSREEITNLAELYDNYLKTFSVIDNVKETIASLRSESREDLISNSDLNILEGELVTMAGKYNYLNKRVVDLKKKALKFILNDIKWFPEVEKRHYNRLAKEHKDSKIIEDKDSWIIDKMQNRDAELIQEDLENTISEFLENPLNDIMASSMVMNSPINISSPLIQIANQMLTSLNNDRINEELKKDKEFKDLFNQLVKEKGTNNINKLYKNIIQYDSNGKPYILSEYNPKFYTDVHQKILSVQNEYSEKLRDIALKRTKAEQKFGRTSKEWKDLNIEYIKVKNEKNKAVKDIQKNNVVKDGKKLRPSDKWKNNIKLTSTEEKVRDFFIDIIETSKANTFGVDPLITFSYGVQFYELPKITKSDKERALKGDVKNIAGDKWKDLTQLRSDDVDYVERYVDQNNEVIKKLKIHYRDKHNFDNKDQSLDLMNIFRLEYKNTNRYKHRKTYESELNFLLDIAENKTYYQREGTKLVFKKNTKKLNEVKGKGSNTYKMLSNMLESRFYDINKKHNLNLGGVDVNKAISFINKGSSALALSLNFASGTANVVNANAQLFLESFIKGRFIKAKSIAKANKIYTANIDKTVTDNINPINKSFVNKINEYFNIHGNINFSNADFLRSDMLKKGFSRQTLQVFQDSGEHWIQSVITMSVLDSIKVLNKDGKFINKKGEVTTEPKAASLLDMLKDNKEADILEVDEKVVYTTHSRLTEWNKGGKDKIDMLITKKIYDSVGNYRDIDQPEIMRHWYGPLLFLFRRYLIPMGVSRLRGMAYSFKDRDELTEAQTKFSYALQEYEEGTYTTLMRYMFKKFKDMNYYLMSLNKPEKASISTNAWASLSDYEKHNIKRAVTELVMTWGILPLAVQFVAAAADDADSEYLFFLAYQLRRLDTELSQYRSIEESFKVMRSPIPSARLIETTGSILLQVLSPWQWHTLDDVYKGGYNKGENKLKTKVIKQVPVLKEFKRTYEDLYDFQNSTFGTGL